MAQIIGPIFTRSLPLCGSKTGYGFVWENPKLNEDPAKYFLVDVPKFGVFEQLYISKAKLHGPKSIGAAETHG